MNEKSSRNNSSVAECFSVKSRWRSNEQVCQGVKCKALLNSHKDWIPSYRRTYNQEVKYFTHGRYCLICITYLDDIYENNATITNESILRKRNNISF